MRAIQFATLGPPDVLRLVEVPEPHVGSGQIRIVVKAAGVNPVDWKIRSGASKRAVPVPLPSIPGMDAAGVVDEIGDGVTGVAIGDAVFGQTVSGATAEFALLEAWARKPAALSFAEASGMPSAVETATRALNELGVRAGETLLISGAAGGVGSAAVQLARERGLRVIGTASEGNQDFLRSLGAEPTTYGPGLTGRVVAIAPEGVDRALDVTGHGVLPELIALVGSTERVMTLADSTAPELGVQFSTGSKGRAFDGLAVAADLYERGRFSLVVSQEFPFEQAAEAHRLSETGHVRGKIVVTVA